MNRQRKSRSLARRKPAAESGSGGSMPGGRGTLGRGQRFWQTGAQNSERDAGEVQGQYQDWMGVGYISTQTGIKRSP